MPLYEYKCQQCSRHTEKRQKFSDAEITVCPHCGGHLQRVITAPAIAFKGGGWYADGYGNAKPKSSGEGSASSEGKTEGSGSESTPKTAADSSSSPAPTAAPAAPSSSAPSSPAPTPAAKS